MADEPGAETSTYEYAVRSLSALIDHLGHAKTLIDKAAQLPRGRPPKEVFDELAKGAPVDRDIARSIFNALDNLVILANELGSPNKALDQAVRVFGKTLPQLEQKKEEIKAILEAYGNDNPVATSAKAQYLAYLHERLLERAEIITDARPVYDMEGKNVLEFVIVHSLVLTQVKDGHRERVHFALDASDLAAVRKACDRAILKQGALKATLGKKARILGEDAENS